MLNSFDAIHEAFVQHPNDFADRPRSYTMHFTNPSQKGSVAKSWNHFIRFIYHSDLINIKSSGIINRLFNDTYKENRHVSLQILKEFGFGKFQVMESRIMREVDELLDTLTSKNGEAYDPWHLMTLSVSNVINSIVFDSRYSSLLYCLWHCDITTRNCNYCC